MSNFWDTFWYSFFHPFTCARTLLNYEKEVAELSFALSIAKQDAEDALQEVEDLKDLNMRLHEKINLLTPEGLRNQVAFPGSPRRG